MKVIAVLVSILVILFVAGTLVYNKALSMKPVTPAAAAQAAEAVRKTVYANTPHTVEARQAYPKALAAKLHDMHIDGKITVAGPDSTTLFVEDEWAAPNFSLAIRRNTPLIMEMDAMGFKLLYYGPPGKVKTFVWHIDEEAKFDRKG